MVESDTKRAPPRRAHLRHVSHIWCSCSCFTRLGHDRATAPAQASRYSAAPGAEKRRRVSAKRREVRRSSGQGSAKMVETAWETVPPPGGVDFWRLGRDGLDSRVCHVWTPSEQKRWSGAGGEGGRRTHAQLLQQLVRRDQRRLVGGQGLEPQQGLERFEALLGVGAGA